MRVLTVRQPWSWAIAHGTKDIENRTGGPNRWRYRGPIAVHAGSGWSARGRTDQRVVRDWQHIVPGPFGLTAPQRVAGLLIHPSISRPEHAHRIVFGAVVALAELVDAHPAMGCCEPWGESTYLDAAGQLRTDVVHLVLENRRPLPGDGVPAAGRLGLWRPDPDLLAELVDA